jgi:hypothetical protein
METSLISTVVLIAALGAADPESPRRSIYENPGDATPRGKIDELVFGQLQQLGIPPARLCSDSVFVRRVYLDAIGTLPTADEAKEFLADRSPDKRRALIDRLLEREEFADYWAMKWSDLLRIKAEFPINLWPNAAQSYHRWIRTNIKQNLPYDRFVREMLTANGSNFRVPQVNFYRAMQNREPQGIAQTVALTFMGARTEKWPKERWSGMADFFAQVSYKSTGEWKEQIVFYDEAKATAQAASEGTKEAVLPDGTRVRLSPDRDPRAVFADWLVAPQNPWFARSIVNRVWSWLEGRGIIHEPDDIRPDNRPSNPELLAYLERELLAARYDLRHIYRLILNSATYQLSSIPRSDQPEAAAHFAFYPLRRLEAEVLIDALCQITGTTEKYTSIIPEPFTYIPEDHRSIALPDGSITSSFLEQFGRPSRDTGLESERNNHLTADQYLHLLNSSHIRDKIVQSPKLKSLLPPEFKTEASPKPQAGSKGPKGAKPQSPARIKSKIDPAARQQAEAQAAAAQREIVSGYYLIILSRFPTEEELKLVAAHSPPRRGRLREGPADLAWSLINSSEFLYRH